MHGMIGKLKNYEKSMRSKVENWESQKSIAPLQGAALRPQEERSFLGDW